MFIDKYTKISRDTYVSRVTSSKIMNAKNVKIDYFLFNFFPEIREGHRL